MLLNSSFYVKAALSIHGMCGGPMLGVFTLGIICPCTNSKVFSPPVLVNFHYQNTSLLLPNSSSHDQMISGNKSLLASFQKSLG